MTRGTLETRPTGRRQQQAACTHSLLHFPVAKQRALATHSHVLAPLQQASYIGQWSGRMGTSSACMPKDVGRPTLPHTLPDASTCLGEVAGAEVHQDARGRAGQAHGRHVRGAARTGGSEL